jgi:hypothetical protein
LCHTYIRLHLHHSPFLGFMLSMQALSFRMFACRSAKYIINESTTCSARMQPASALLQIVPPPFSFPLLPARS